MHPRLHNKISILVNGLNKFTIDNHLIIYKIRSMLTFNLIIYFLFTQSPEIKWGRVYGGEGNDYGRGVLECADKGFIAVGSTNSFGNGGFDVYILKTDSLGYPVWTKTYGGAQDDYGYAICPAKDSGYIIVGATSSFGQGMSDIFVIKINEDGDSIWIRTYGDSMDEIGYSITEANDNNYVITGITSSSGAGGVDIYTIKIDSQGELIWSKTYGGNLDDLGFCVDATNDGGCIIAGTTFSFGNGSGDVYLVKTDSLGGIEWTRIYGTNNDEKGLCVQQTADSGYIVCGSAYVILLNYEWCLLRYNHNGSLVWDNFQGSLNDDFAYSVQEIFQKNYIIGGNFSYEMYVVRTDTEGLNVWMLIYGGAGTDCAFSVKQTADSGYIIAGITDSYGAGGYDLYLVKTYPDQVAIEENLSQTNPPSSTDIEISPNPFYDRIKISYHKKFYGCIKDIKIYDVTGRLVKTFNNLTNYQLPIHWDGSDNVGNHVSAGIYYIITSSAKGYISKKAIKK